MQAQIIGNGFRTGKRDVFLQILAQNPPADFFDDGKLGKTRQTHALVCRKRFRVGTHQLAQAAKLIQQITRQIHRAHPTRTHPQQNRQ